MRLHRPIARLHIRVQLDVDRRCFATLFAPALKREADGVGTRHLALDCLADGSLQIGGVIAVEKPHPSMADGAALGRAKQQIPAGRRNLSKAVGGTMLPSGSILIDQRLEMLDQNAAILATAMQGNHLRAVDDAKFVDVGEDRQCPLYTMFG